MDYTNLFRNNNQRKARVGIIGATRGYGYTLLAQIPSVDLITLRVICSRHQDECREVLKELGYDERRIIMCSNKSEVVNAPKDAIIVVSDYRLVVESDITSLVECTGNTAVSVDAALVALRKGINVYMVSKEADSVCGPYLNQVAADSGAVYSLVNGDQPRNLLDLCSWARMLGLEIIAAGKSSEYDFLWDPDTGDLSYLDNCENLPELRNCWRYNGRDTLNDRRSLLEKYISNIPADLCEMNVVSNVLGFVAAAPRLSYPVAKVSELADIFIPVEDGGILTRQGVVDVFYNLRAPDEASFAGGVFIIVKCHNERVWDLLKDKGHLVSRNGKYACIYHPYHFLGVETPLSIIIGDVLGIGSHPECRQVSILAGVAERDLPKGTVLTVHGHHHSIDGLIPELLERSALSSPEEMVPFYLLNGMVLTRDVKEGETITTNAVDISKCEQYKFYVESLRI